MNTNDGKIENNGDVGNGGNVEQTKTNGTLLEYSFKSDVLFKMLFVRHQGLLKRLVAALLGLNEQSINEFTVRNTEIPPEIVGKKFCRLDILMDVDGRKINLEIQNRDEGNFAERTMFHWARAYSSSLPKGIDYAELPQTIIISIIDFVMFDCAEVHSEFQLMEVNRHEHFSDKQIYHFFELKKLKGIDELNPNNEKDIWLALFNAKTVEDLEKITKKGGAVMNEAVHAYNTVTADESFRTLEWLRQKAEHDEAQALYNARRLGHIERDEHWQGVVADIVADKDNAIAALADKDTEIEQLRRQLAELQGNKN